MKKFWNWLKNGVHKIMSTKIGKFIFEILNIIALVIAAIALFCYSFVLIGFLMVFCLFSAILILVDKYKKKDGVQ